MYSAACRYQCQWPVIQCISDELINLDSRRQLIWAIHHYSIFMWNFNLFEVFFISFSQLYKLHSHRHSLLNQYIIFYSGLVECILW